MVNWGKLVIFAFLLSSCSVLDVASKAVTTPYQWGKFQGRQELLEELELNKKKLNELKKVVSHQLLDLGLEEEKEFMIVLPGMLAVAQLLSDRQGMKEELATLGTETAKED